MAKKGKKNSCIYIPNVPGTKEGSKMYVELDGITNYRPITTMLYAHYMIPGVAEAMDQRGYMRNSQGQHRGKDVYEFLGGRNFRNDVITNIKRVAEANGFMQGDNFVDFADSEVAYQKAKTFNDTSKSYLAYVVKNGTAFNVIVDNRNANTFQRLTDTDKSIRQWEVLKNHLINSGIDIDSLKSYFPQIFNPGSVPDFMQNLSSLPFVATNMLTDNDVLLLMLLNPNLQSVKNLMNRGWGNIEETAKRARDIAVNNSGTQGNKTFVSLLLDEMKKLKGLDVKSIRDDLQAISKDYDTNDRSGQIQNIISDLNKKYKLDRDAFVRKASDITKISEAVADSILSLKRQIRIIEQRVGINQRSEDLRATLDKLMQELENFQSVDGLLDFMKTGYDYLQIINSELDSLVETGTKLDFAITISNAVSRGSKLFASYYPIVNALARADKLFNDMAVRNLPEIKSNALALKDSFDGMNEKLAELRKKAMFNVGEEFLGTSNSLYGKDLATIINMAEADSTAIDYLYSIGRISNPVGSVLGAVIRDAQNERDKRLVEIQVQIDRATYDLYESKSDSKFMYDSKGRIVSNYDWDEYAKQKSKYSATLSQHGIKRGTLEHLAEMEEWENQHTELLEVDHLNHRFERVPIYKLSTDFKQGWTPAQIKYYDTMMELKGQIGSMLPNYAQHQFVPPQVRNDLLMILKEAIKKERPFKDVFERVWDNTKIMKIKAADSRFYQNGIYLGGEEYAAVISDYDNTILRQIPVFYINKVDSGELSHDFSGALLSLASTACNYTVMDRIKNLAELMTDYVDNTPVASKKVGKNVVDYERQEELTVAKQISKNAKEAKLSHLLHMFVMKQVYGMEMTPPETVFGERMRVLLCNLIGYTSFKGLALNVKGAFTNRFVGVMQTILKASGGRYFNWKDLVKAEAILMGEIGTPFVSALFGGAIGGPVGAAVGLTAGTAMGIKGQSVKFMDILTNSTNSIDSLIARFFDATQSNYSEISHKRYHQTVAGKLFGAFNPMFMYERGEYWIHMLNVYAILSHEKVLQRDPASGKVKKISLYDAFTKGEKISGNSELEILDNIYKMDGQRLKDTKDPYFDEIKRRMRFVNQQCHGSMNKEDKGIIHQYMLGKLAMNFRQWMVEHYSRRYRGLHWDESIRDVNLSNFYNNTKVLLDGKKVKLFDALEAVDDGNGNLKYQIRPNATTLRNEALTDEVINDMLEAYAEDTGWTRGFYASSAKVVWDMIKDINEYRTLSIIKEKQLTDSEKESLIETISEFALWGVLASLGVAMGDPDEHKGEFYYRLLQYILKRTTFDVKASLPFGAVTEATTMMQNPFASVRTMQGLLYPVYGLISLDFLKTIQSGRYAGWNKYGRNLLKYTLPFYHQVDQLLHIAEEDAAFAVFDNTMR